MIARDIIVSFYIFSLLKYDKIFGKTWSKTQSLTNKVLDQHFAGVVTRISTENLC